MTSRMCRQRGWRGAAAVSAAALACGLAITLGGVFGAFASTNANPSNNFASAPDYVAPSVSRSVIGKTQGGTPGYIHQGGTYQVYAEVTDSGNPASGVSTVSSNSATVTTGATSTSLASGSFPIGGLSYGRQSASLTANATLPAGTYNYSVSSTDVAGNSGSSNFSVTVDNTVPTGTDIQTANGGSLAGRPEQNDTITYTFSEPIDPNSIIAGWTGAATNVVVRVNDGLLSNDQVQIFNSTNTSQLPLGNVNLGRLDYTLLNLTFGATGTASSMSMSGNAITVQLGNPSTLSTSALGAGAMIWTPSATATDYAGNATSTTSRTETGTADIDF